jgi:hypothetical protein
MTDSPRAPIRALRTTVALIVAFAAALLGPAPTATAASDPPGTPFGHFESAVAVPGGVQVKGWAVDPDTAAPIYVWVTLDGVGRHLVANVPRPDVGAALPGFGPDHGFLGTLTAAAGTHAVCVTASNVGPGAHKPLGCRSVTVLAGSPFGNFEGATVVGGNVQVKGWAIDPDTTAPIYVWVTVDGVGRHLYANVNRPDVGAAYPGYGPNHGFTGTLTVGPGSHTVCVTASNVGPGSHRSLGCRTVAVVPPGSPFGNFETAVGVPGGIYVEGWAIDPDTTAPIYVWVTVDGVGRHLYAHVNRPDVAAAFPGFGANHGFAAVVGAAPGHHTVCVTASNVGAGAHRGLGCRVVLALGQQAIWPASDVVFATPEAAAEDFVVNALGVPADLGDFQAGDARSGEIEVLFGEGGGTPVVRSLLDLRQLGPDDGWFVQSAINPNASITSPGYFALVPAGPLTVQGLGRGFEGLVVVEAFPPGNADLLDQEITSGGSTGTPEPFSVSLDLSGTSPGDVVTLLVRGGVGNENDPGDFGAIPVVIGG